MSKTKIYKNQGKIEYYDPIKLKAGVLSSCLAVQTPPAAAKNFADSVEKKVAKALKNQTAMTLRDLKRVAKKNLSLVHPDAAEVYAIEEEF